MNGYDKLKAILKMSELDIYKEMHDNFIIDCTKNRRALLLEESPIHGLGVFAKEFIPKGSDWLAAYSNVKYICGRFINHSDDPNCKFEFTLAGTLCIALKDIKAGEELTVSYLDNVNKLRGMHAS